MKLWHSRAERVPTNPIGIPTHTIPDDYWLVPVAVDPQEASPLFSETFVEMFGHPPLPAATPQPQGAHS